MNCALSLVLLLAANVHAQSDIVDTAVASNFTILAEALTKADLVTTLKGTGPFTVFAPTDAAFAAALTKLGITKEELLNRTDLGAILTYHVVSGSVMSANLTNGMTAATVQGASLTVTINGSTVKVNTATVTSADVVCSNGVIHIIDEVLLPPAEDPAPTSAPAADTNGSTPAADTNGSTPAADTNSSTPAADTDSSTTAAPAGGLKDIVDTAVGAGVFTVLAEALTKADLVTTAKSAGPFTVFAPTDTAFAAALQTLGITKEELLAKEDLSAILTYHIVSGTVKSTDLTNGMEGTTVNGAKVTITIDGSTVKINNVATVTEADIMCSNGVIHIIDQVLLPPAGSPTEAAPSGSSATTSVTPTTTGGEVAAAYSTQKFASLMFGGLLSAFVFA